MKNNIYDELKNIRKNKLDNSYNETVMLLYKDCIKKINILNNTGVLNYSYEILHIHPNIGYITKEINKLLIKNKFKTNIINVNVINIDWS